MRYLPTVWNKATKDYECVLDDIQGGDCGSVSLSDDGSALAVGLPVVGDDKEGSATVRRAASSCDDDSAAFCLSITTNESPGSIAWVVLKDSEENVKDSEGDVLAGGPYEADPSVYPSDMMKGLPFAHQSCIPVASCSNMTAVITNREVVDSDSSGWYALYFDGKEGTSNAAGFPTAGLRSPWDRSQRGWKKSRV